MHAWLSWFYANHPWLTWIIGIILMLSVIEILDAIADRIRYGPQHKA